MSVNKDSGRGGRDTQVISIEADLREGLALPEHFEELAREHGVPEAAMPELKARSLSIIAHKRRDGAAAFAFGDDIVAVAAHFDDEAFEEFAVKAYPYSFKHVNSFKRVAAELGPWRGRSIRASLSSTHLIRLLARTPDERDEILHKVEAGDKVTAADISTWGNPKEEAADPMSVGSLKGLRALAQAKAKAGSASFGANVGKVMAAIDEALASGKSIAKKGLSEQIQKPARQASGELLNLGAFVEAGPFGDVAPAAFPAESEWGKVHAVLDQVGHEGLWPKKPELGSWLRDTVLPVLRWAFSGSEPAKGPEVRIELAAPAEASSAEIVVVDSDPEIKLPVEPAEVAAKPKRTAKPRKAMSAAAKALKAFEMPDDDRPAVSAARR